MFSIFWITFNFTWSIDLICNTSEVMWLIGTDIFFALFRPLWNACNRKSVFLPFVCWKSALLLFCYLARRTWLGLWCKFKTFEVQILPSWWRKVIIKLPRELSVTDSRNVFSLVHSEEENCRSKNFPFSIVITVECFSS